MRCQWHDGQQTAFTCMKCGRGFCRLCLAETNNMHYCPGCNRERVQRLASQMQPQPRRARAPRAGKGGRPVTSPARAPRPSPAREVQEAPAAPERPPGAGDRDEAWIVPADRPDRYAPGSPGPAGPPVPGPEAGLDAGEEPRGSDGPARGFGPRKLKPPKERRSSWRAPEQAVAEPTESLLTPEERAAFWGESAAGAAAADGRGPAAEVVKDEYAPPAGRLAALMARRRRKASPVVMQIPEEYAGEMTASPSYVRAVLFGLLAGVVLAAGYAGFEWWRHSGRWIFGWVLGFGVGLVVVFASGRHFNWKLGLASAVIAWASLGLGQLAFSMLDVRFNSILPIKLPFMTLLEQAARELLNAFASSWSVMFAVTGLVAFLVSFRPWPVKVQL